LKINYDICAACYVCIDKCPENAIAKVNFKLTIKENCTNCGECLDFCPIGAIYKD